MKKGEKSQFQGTLGDEFNKVFDALAEANIIPADGMEIKKTSSGTVVKPQVQPAPAGGQAVMMTRAAGNMVDTIIAQPFIEDIYGRVIALPPIHSIDLSNILQPYSHFKGALVDGYYDENKTVQAGFPWGFIYPTAYTIYDGSHVHPDELFLSNGGYRSKLGRDEYTGYKSYEPLLIAALDEPIRIPIRIVDAANWGTYRTGIHKWQINGGGHVNLHYVECDFIDLNLAGKVWREGL
jgi:hypothetical protein